ncbi:MAG: hypothetical protein AAF731_19770 [Bacteroidota bacterium]
MKVLTLFFVLFMFDAATAQSDTRISTIEFVQILDDNREEALFYYQNNWKVLREMAVKKSYIDSFGLLEVEFTEDQPYHIILMTTFANKDQFEKSEQHFEELIKAKGPLRLLNEKKPGEFRKNLYLKERVMHLN